jgi:hypothetical protein
MIEDFLPCELVEGLCLAALPIRGGSVAPGFRRKLIPVMREPSSFSHQLTKTTQTIAFSDNIPPLKATTSDDCVSTITWNSAKVLTYWSFSYRSNTTTSRRFTCSRSCLKARPLSQFHLTQRYQKPSNWGTSVKPQTKSCLSGQRRKS